MPTILAIECAQDIYKTIETSHSIATNTRNTDCNISGRYAYSGPNPRKTVVNFSECCQSTTTSGISHQTGEMLPSPIPVSRVPGILDQLEGDDTSCTQRQTPKAPNRVQECNPESLADAERTLGFIRQNEPLLPSGSSPGTFALSCSTEATYQQHSPEQTSLEQDKGLSDRKITNRPPMVDSSHGSRIVTKYYTPQVDLFASRLNHQLPLYVSRHPEPGAMEVDAITLQWNRWTSFIHAPIIMLPRILKKIREDQATCLLIAPNLPGQTWYPLLLEMLVNIPSLLPMTETSLYLPFDRETQHPLWRTMKLAVWPLSGNVVEQEVCHRKFVTSLWPPADKERKRDMKVLGDFGLAGVSHGINVHFQPL